MEADIRYNNFLYLFVKMFSIDISIFREHYMYLLNEIQSKKDNYLSFSSSMLVDDFSYEIDYSSIDTMEDGNELFFIFENCEITSTIYIYLNIGQNMKIKMGLLENYPREIIPIFLRILKKMFPYLVFTERNFYCQIWNMTQINIEFIQYLFLILTNIQNPEFHFITWVNSDVPIREGNNFSAAIKRKIMERANYCCESCRRNVNLLEKINGKKPNIDHIIEHRFGGTNNEDNAQLLCHDCHCKKTTWNKRKF